MLNNTIDLTGVTASRGFEPIPAGDYNLTIVDASQQLTKAGDGEYLKIKFEVVDGEHAGRYVWQNYNLKNKNDMAVQIGKSQLKSMLLNASYDKEQVDLNDLMGLEVVGVVRIKEGQNTIAGYKVKGSVAATQNPTDQDVPF